MTEFFYQFVIPVVFGLFALKYLFCYGIGYLLCGLYLKRMKIKEDSLPPHQVKLPEGLPAPEVVNLKTFILNLINGYIRYAIQQTGQIPSHTIRNFIYQNFFYIKIDRNAVIYAGAEIRGTYKLQIGEGSIIGDQAILDARNRIYIGKHVNMSTGVWIWTEQHDLNSPWFSSEGGPVHIGDRAWISARAIILPGVTIGEGAVVAAGAVVTKNIEPFAIYGGIPAKKIGSRNPDLIYNFAGNRLKFL